MGLTDDRMQGIRKTGISDSLSNKEDGKYREHYNRSIHSGNNPGQGHDKQKDKNKGNGKKN